MPGNSPGWSNECVVQKVLPGTIRVVERSTMWALCRRGCPCDRQRTGRRACQPARSNRSMQIPSEGPLRRNADTSRNRRHNTVERTSAHRLWACVDPGHLTWAPSAGLHQRPREGARVRSSWVTLEPASALCSGQPHRQGAPPLEQDVDADEYADFTKEYRLQHERITLPTTFNTK